MANLGQVWRHAAYYTDRDTGESLPKFLLVIGVAQSGDIIYKLLTSKVDHRPTSPACSHDDVRPGFYIGIPQSGGLLSKETWLDLRESDDYDLHDFTTDVRNGALTLVHELSQHEMCDLLECAANSQDVTKRQRDGIMDARATLGCS